MKNLLSLLAEYNYTRKEKKANRARVNKLKFFDIGIYDLGNLHTSGYYNCWLYSHDETLDLHLKRKYLASCLTGIYSVEVFIKMFLCTKTDTNEIELLDESNLYFSTLIKWASKYYEFKEVIENLNELNLLRNKLLFHVESQSQSEFQSSLHSAKFGKVSNIYNYYITKQLDGEKFETYWCKYINETYKMLNVQIVENISKIESTIEKKLLEKYLPIKNIKGKTPCIMVNRQMDTEKLFFERIKESSNPHIQDILDKKKKTKGV